MSALAPAIAKVSAKQVVTCSRLLAAAWYHQITFFLLRYGIELPERPECYLQARIVVYERWFFLVSIYIFYSRPALFCPVPLYYASEAPTIPLYLGTVSLL